MTVNEERVRRVAEGMLEQMTPQQAQRTVQLFQLNLPPTPEASEFLDKLHDLLAVAAHHYPKLIKK